MHYLKAELRIQGIKRLMVVIIGLFVYYNVQSLIIFISLTSTIPSDPLNKDFI